MTSLTTDRLYTLLPAVYRLRDAAQGKPLEALVAALAREFAALEDNLDQLYDDQFIETCADWVAPYIGDLVGYRPLHGVAPAIASPRAEVGNTIAYRRRKGTALMLEQLAHDVTDWPAHAVEFFEQLATTQYMKHLRPHAPATARVRDEAAMRSAGSAFNTVAHTAEMRRPETGAGRYNVPNIGIFLWRLQALPLSAVPLTPDTGDASGRKFRVNPLGTDLQLFRVPKTEDDIGHLAEPVNVPEPLKLRRMAHAMRAGQDDEDDYGPGQSLLLLQPDRTPVPANRVRVCDLRDIVDGGGNVTGWNHEDGVPAGTVGIDPERGRVLLGAAVDGPLLASFHYGQARAIGGGEYQRMPSLAPTGAQRSVQGAAALQPELDAIAGGGRLLVEDSLTYAQTPVFKADAARQVVVSAANPARPLIAASADITLEIGAHGELVIEGLVFSGGTLHLPAAADDEPRALVLRDCTLVPGASGLRIDHPFARVTLERCITGPLQAVAGATVQVTDSVVDAGAPTSVAYAADDAGHAGATLTLVDSTVVGKVHTRAMQLMSNSILFAALGPAPGETWDAPVIAERRQEGCVRFCFVPTGSITPRRHRCMPDAAHRRALPLFTSLRYGDAGYIQLRAGTDAAIREGADDGSEMGVLRPLCQPQRETNLRLRLDEYLRFGLHAGLFYVT